MQQKLNDLEVYKEAIRLSKHIWTIYIRLSADLKFSIGKQVLQAVDSIGANIAEGFGRYHYKDKIRFFYNARGSLWESKHWVLLLYQRELISAREYDFFVKRLEKLGKQLNTFIAKTGNSNV